MKSTFIAIISTLAALGNAGLTYDAASSSIKCSSATGSYCASTDLLVSCAGSIGTLSKCSAGLTCSETSLDSGDAKCAAASTSSSVTPVIVDSLAEDCDCDEPHPPPVSSSSVLPPPPPPPSSTPMSFSRFSTSSSTPVGPIKASSTPHYIPPPPPSSTPVAPAKISSFSIHYGTATSGMPKPTSKVTTLNSSWKPTLSSSVRPSSTSASPAIATTNAAITNRANAVVALGMAGIIALLT